MFSINKTQKSPIDFGNKPQFGRRLKFYEILFGQTPTYRRKKFSELLVGNLIRKSG
jgi:hypothetical protein